MILRSFKGCASGAEGCGGIGWGAGCGLETEPKSCVLFFGLCLEIFNQGVGKKSGTVYNFSDLIKNLCLH